MTKRGRPRIAVEKRCTEVITVKVPPSIMAYMRCIAESRDMSIPEFTRWWYERLYEKKPEYRVTEKS